jgi:2-polyprenyl-3-methyl-5-hydroxy-6-metoxy-1,4-benzoquinol methylase
MKTNRVGYIASCCAKKKVLDIGCVDTSTDSYIENPNWLHGAIWKTAKKLVGLDYNDKGVDVLNAAGFNVVNENIEDFFLLSVHNPFEVIVAAEILEHTNNLGMALECINKHLATNGILIITVPNASSLFGFIQTLIFGHERLNDDHTISFTLKNLTTLLKRFKLHIVKQEWIVEDTSIYYTGIRKLFMKLVFFTQIVVCSVFPQISKNILVVAKKGVDDGL